MVVLLVMICVWEGQGWGDCPFVSLQKQCGVGTRSRRRRRPLQLASMPGAGIVACPCLCACSVLGGAASGPPCEWFLSREGGLHTTQEVLRAHLGELPRRSARLSWQAGVPMPPAHRGQPPLLRMPAPRPSAGNRPSTSLLLPSLTPYRVGQLLALYENRVATQVGGWRWWRWWCGWVDVCMRERRSLQMLLQRRAAPVGCT